MPVVYAGPRLKRNLEPCKNVYTTNLSFSYWTTLPIFEIELTIIENKTYKDVFYSLHLPFLFLLNTKS